MSYRLFCKCATLFCISVVLFGADKKLPIDETSNELLDISVSAPLDKDQIKQELGSDLGDDIIVVRLTARPVSDKPVQLSLDDFLLVSAKDGQRSEPFEPGQIGRIGQSFGYAQWTQAGWETIGPGLPSASGDSESEARQFRQHSDPGREGDRNRATKKRIRCWPRSTPRSCPKKQITEPTSGLLFFQVVGQGEGEGPGAALQRTGGQNGPAIQAGEVESPACPPIRQNDFIVCGGVFCI